MFNAGLFVMNRPSFLRAIQKNNPKMNQSFCIEGLDNNLSTAENFDKFMEKALEDNENPSHGSPQQKAPIIDIYELEESSEMKQRRLFMEWYMTGIHKTQDKINTVMLEKIIELRKTCMPDGVDKEQCERCSEYYGFPHTNCCIMICGELPQCAGCTVYEENKKLEFETE